MATFFQDTTVGSWAGNTMTGTLTGDVSRSGNTVTLSNMVLTLRCPAGGAWGSEPGGWFEVNGTKTNFTITATGDGYGLGSYNLASTSFSVSASQTSANVGWSSNDGVTGSFSVSFPQGTIAPNTPSVSLTVVSDDVINVIWGTSSFGNPSSGTVYLYGGTSSSPTTQIASKTTTGNSTSVRSSLAANTRYYYRSRAKNTDNAWSSYSSDSAAATKAKAPTVIVGTVTDTSVQLNYTQDADGGFYDKYVEYSINGGTAWIGAATITGGAAQSGTITISNLTPETTYTIQTRTRTTSGNSAGPTLTATTEASVKLYGSVNGQTKRVTKLYGSVNGQTKKILKLYGSVNGVTKLIYQD